VITKTRYVLAVPDLKRSAAYYEQVLGFNVYEIEDPGWRFAKLGNCMLMLGECPDAIPPGELGDHAYFAYLEVENVDTFFASVQSKGGIIRHPPKDCPWGMREFALQTIDGHRIMIGAPIV